MVLLIAVKKQVFSYSYSVGAECKTLEGFPWYIDIFPWYILHALKWRSVRCKGTEDILKGCSFSLLQLLMQGREKHSDLSGKAEKENQRCQQTLSAWSFCVTYLFFHLNLFCSRQGLIHLPATAAHCSGGTSVTAGDRWWVSAGQQGGKGTWSPSQLRVQETQERDLHHHWPNAIKYWAKSWRLW